MDTSDSENERTNTDSSAREYKKKTDSISAKSMIDTAKDNKLTWWQRQRLWRNISMDTYSPILSYDRVYTATFA